MRKAGGYAVTEYEGGEVLEWDTFTCCHCGGVRRVPAGYGPEDFCRMCMKPICVRCAAKRECTPIMRRIEEMEERAYRRRVR